MAGGLSICHNLSLTCHKVCGNVLPCWCGEGVVEAIEWEIVANGLGTLADEGLLFGCRMASAVELVEEVSAGNLAETEKAELAFLLFGHPVVLLKESQGITYDQGRS